MPTDEELYRLADVLDVAGRAYERDLVELEKAGADESFREAWAANPEPDPDTDGVEHE
jgi:hypothetical protein